MKQIYLHLSVDSSPRPPLLSPPPRPPRPAAFSQPGATGVVRVLMEVMEVMEGGEQTQPPHSQV